MKQDTNRVESATELTVAWRRIENTGTFAVEVPAFFRAIYAALAGLEALAGQAGGAVPERPPAVTARMSLASPEHFVSMTDRKPYRMLRRHLGRLGLTPERYRQRFKLRSDDPVMALGYSEARRAIVRKIRLGRKPGEARAKPISPPTYEKAPRRHNADTVGA